ncbi:C39 family peptidase [Haloferax sp. AB510]|uniref:C39 family peptidase n=1 Tax=Haloferax sp. AB510 TaxID=2934172 RepID=UPI00209BD2CF|nr:C39 family peptidase [Haloferax sp. AB510]MCO8266548.1 C39 family peptidase [Haloferax sp. AB510]
MVRKHHRFTRRNAIKTIGLAGLTLSGAGVGSAIESGKKKYVSKGLAKKAARQRLALSAQSPKYASWVDADLGKSTTFYLKNKDKGPNYLRSSYVFPVLNGSTHVGYITASAQRDRPAIIEQSTAPHPLSKLSEVREFRKQRGDRDTGRLIHHTGTKYGLEMQDGAVANLRNGQKQTVGKGTTTDALAADSEQTKRIWDAVESSNESLSTTDSTTIQPTATGWSGSKSMASDVPAYDQTLEDGEPRGDPGGGSSSGYVGSDPDPWGYWDGCSPIAAAMVLNYHEGYSQNGSYEAAEAMIDELHDEFGTFETDPFDGATPPGFIDDGIRSYSGGDNDYGSKSIAVTLDRVFAEGEIDNDRPFVLNMTSGDTASGRDQPYNEHSVAGIGYDASKDTLELYDTWGYNSHDLSWGAWLAATVTKVFVK